MKDFWNFEREGSSNQDSCKRFLKGRGLPFKTCSRLPFRSMGVGSIVPGHREKDKEGPVAQKLPTTFSRDVELKLTCKIMICFVVFRFKYDPLESKKPSQWKVLQIRRAGPDVRDATKKSRGHSPSTEKLHSSERRVEVKTGQ